MKHKAFLRKCKGGTSEVKMYEESLPKQAINTSLQGNGDLNLEKHAFMEGVYGKKMSSKELNQVGQGKSLPAYHLQELEKSKDAVITIELPCPVEMSRLSKEEREMVESTKQALSALKKEMDRKGKRRAGGEGVLHC